MAAEWRSIVGYEGLYEVSSDGLVRSLSRVVRHWQGGTARRPGRVLRPGQNKKGYLMVVLCRDRNEQTRFIARLVAQTFIPNPTRLPQVNHLNGVKADNKVGNLEWTDNSGNQKHAWATGLQPQRRRAECPRGHSMKDAYERPDGEGRMCRTCARERAAARNRLKAKRCCAA
jgi:hypothetical protein